MRFFGPIYAVPHVPKKLKHAAKMRQKNRIKRRLCSENLYICGDYAVENYNYAVIMRQYLMDDPEIKVTVKHQTFGSQLNRIFSIFPAFSGPAI